MIPYILKTLQQNDYVYIDRLGVFRVQMRHAEIDGDVVRPPFNEVVFTPNDDTENNYALANIVSRELQCLFTEANERITAWVDELLSALQHNKSVSYEDFGTFMLDKKGNISFQSAVIPQLNSIFEGMDPIDLNVPVTDVVEANNDSFSNQEPVEEPEPVGANDDSPSDPEHVEEPEPVGANDNSPSDSEHVEEPEPVEDENEDEDEDENEDNEKHKKRRRWAWLWVVLLLVVNLAVLGFIFKDWLKDHIQQWIGQKTPVEQEEVTVESGSDATAAYEESTTIDTLEEDQPEPEIVEPEVYTPEVLKKTADGKYEYIRFEEGHFYAIAGSLPNEADAERHIRQKKLDAYSPKILLQDGVGKLRVCIGIFDTEEEAEQFAKSINPKYWVLK